MAHIDEQVCQHHKVTELHARRTVNERGLLLNYSRLRRDHRQQIQLRWSCCDVPCVCKHLCFVQIDRSNPRRTGNNETVIGFESARRAAIQVDVALRAEHDGRVCVLLSTHTIIRHTMATLTMSIRPPALAAQRETELAKERATRMSAAILNKTASVASMARKKHEAKESKEKNNSRTQHPHTYRAGNFKPKSSPFFRFRRHSLQSERSKATAQKA